MRLKLTPYGSEDSDYYKTRWENHWVLNEAGDSEIRAKFPDRENVTVLGEISDKEADYSYDDWALCEYKGKYYMFNTSGCSCPSPSETYGIAYESESIDGLRKAMLKDKSEYGVPGRQWNEFLELFKEVKKGEKDE